MLRIKVGFGGGLQVVYETGTCSLADSKTNLGANSDHFINICDKTIPECFFAEVSGDTAAVLNFDTLAN
jgi:hypothetical protein